MLDPMLDFGNHILVWFLVCVIVAAFNQEAPESHRMRLSGILAYATKVFIPIEIGAWVLWFVL